MEVLPVFSCNNFRISGFRFASLIHLKLVFVYSDRYRSNFSILHVGIQFPQNHLFKMLSSLQLKFLGIFVQILNGRSQVYSYLGLQFSSNSTCLFVPVSHFIYYYDSVMYILRSVIVNPPELFFLLRTAFTVWGLLWFYVTFNINIKF